MIPYIIFIVLLLHSLTTFLMKNLGVEANVVSATYGLLVVVPLGYILVNLHEIYVGKISFFIKIILPWIFFMWMTSFGILATYPLRSVVRGICFQSGPLLMFLCFFIQGKSCEDKKFKTNQKLFFILTLVTIFFFCFERARGGQYFSGGLVKVGSVLYLAMLLPWISTFKNKGLRYTLLAGLSCLVLFSMKRSAFFLVAVGGFFYVLVQNVIIEQKKKIFFIFLTPLVLLGLFLVVSYVDRSTSGVLLEQVQNIKEDKGSGRLDMWADLWYKYKMWPLANRIFGKGFYATTNYLGEMPAHNDFIEALWGYGIIGFLANVFFSIYLLFKAAGMVLRKHPYAASFVFGVISFWILSMVSYNLYTMLWSLYLLAFLGYICGIDQQEKDICTLYPDLTTMELHQLRQDWYTFDVPEERSEEWIEMTQ